MTDSFSKLAIGLITLMLFAAVSGWCLYKGASEATMQMILTALIAWCGSTIGYFLGSSAGSAAKDKAITDLTTPK
jgi:CDP-diglyceride synthetase